MPEKAVQGLNKGKDLPAPQSLLAPETEAQAKKRKEHEQYLALRSAMLRDAVTSNNYLAERRREQRAEQKKAEKAALREPEVVTQFSAEFGQQEVVRPKPQVSLQNCAFLSAGQAQDLSFVHFLNNANSKSFKGLLQNLELMQLREVSRNSRYRLGRPPLATEDKQDSLYSEDTRLLSESSRPVIGSTGLSGVVAEGNYQATPSGGLQTLSGEFVCVTCKRGPPHTKKYAKNQCQTCYKKTKKAQRFEDGIFLNNMYANQSGGFLENQRSDLSSIRR